MLTIAIAGEDSFLLLQIKRRNMNARAIGMLIGIIVGVIICAIIFITANTNGKMKTEYDERQKEIRGKGFMISFFTVLVLLGIMVVLEVAEIKLPAQQSVIYMTIIILSVATNAVYNIINDGYWGLNNSKRKYEIYFIIISLVNFLVPFSGGLGKLYTTEEGFTLPCINLLCGILFIILFAVILAKDIISRAEENEEGEEE